MNIRNLRRREFALGLLVGAGVGLIGIVVGFIGVVVALAATVVFGVLEPTRARLAGGLMAIGALWLVLVWNTVAACASTADFCGGTNVAPLLAVAVVPAAGGLLLAARVWFRARQLARS
jgi:hypothetical protein